MTETRLAAAAAFFERHSPRDLGLACSCPWRGEDWSQHAAEQLADTFVVAEPGALVSASTEFSVRWTKAVSDEVTAPAQDSLIATQAYVRHVLADAQARSVLGDVAGYVQREVVTIEGPWRAVPA